jgi:ribosomal protein S14
MDKEAPQDFKQYKQCINCGSRNTYFTKTIKFCRSCGFEQDRDDIEVKE